MPIRTLLVLLLACCTGHAAPPAADGWPQQVLQAVNVQRQAQGLPALAWSDALVGVALGHSQRMADERRLSHDGFQARFDAVDSDLCVENVAAGTLQAQVLVNAWSRATLHRRNLLEPRVRRAAVAAVRGYVTLFACE
ncbi:MAG: CAP domain-containing protein [Rubrivivax sp.]|nr:CAP domain-containing protein [Rubrivivax sp.]